MDNTVRRFILPAAYSLLPPTMNTAPASALLFAIGLQESRFEYRAQVKGPARGFWQFEAMGGVLGVLTHPISAPLVRDVLAKLQYRQLPSDAADRATAVHGFLTHNDVLAAALARLLLWTDPRPLPVEGEGPEAAWQAYVRNWRPGKPHRETWDAFWLRGWSLARINI